jgi:hypothetical protein
MNGCEKLIKHFWTCLAATLISVALLVGAYNVHRSYAIQQMVKGGANPLDAACAFEAGRYTQVTCLARAQRVER